MALARCSPQLAHRHECGRRPRRGSDRAVRAVVRKLFAQSLWLHGPPLQLRTPRSPASA